MESVIVFHIYAELFYSFDLFFILSIYFLFFRVLFIEILSDESLQPDSIKTGYYAIEGSSTYPVDAVVLTLSM